MAFDRFKGKTVLITGAGSGIGRETSLAFAREGAAVIAVDLSLGGLEQTKHLIEAEGGNTYIMPADITDEAAVEELFVEAISVKGGIDYAFNNAGITQSNVLTADIAKSEFERVLQVNVIGVWLCMRKELQHMVARGSGVIVNTGSFLSSHAMPLQTAYTASKHALMGLTKSAAIEYGPQGIRINAVAPGAIPTGMMAESYAGLTADQHALAMRQLADLHPMKRIGTVREIADAVLFLCSNEASFISGACLAVDGGWAAS